MSKLAGQMLTTRGVAAFWLAWCAAFVLMLWAVSPGRTLQDALAAELLQGHLAGGYQLRNPPLYEWLLWGMQQLVGPGQVSYLVLRYALIAATGLLFYAALLRAVPSQRLAAAFSLSLVLFYWFGWKFITASPIRSHCSPLRSRCSSPRLPMPNARQRRAHFFSDSSSASGSWPNGASCSWR